MAQYARIIKSEDMFMYKKGFNGADDFDNTIDPDYTDMSKGICCNEIKHIFNFITYGDVVCILRDVCILENDTRVMSSHMMYKFKSIYIIKFMPLWDLDTIKTLVSLGADAHINKNTLFLHASKYGHLDIVKYLVSLGTNVRVCGDMSVRQASMNGHLKMVKYLIFNGADSRLCNDLAFRLAAKNGHLHVVKFFVSMGVDIHISDDYAVCKAAKYGHIHVVKYLVSLGADIHINDDYAYKRAMENHHFDVAEYLTNPEYQTNPVKDIQNHMDEMYETIHEMSIAIQNMNAYTKISFKNLM